MILKKFPILLFLLEIPFIYLAHQYMVRNSLVVYDASSHLASVWYLKEYLWPGFSGLNPYNLLGFDQGILYPSLFHYLAASVSFFVGVETGTKLVVAISLVLLPAAVYLFTTVLVSGRNARAFITAVLLITILVLPGYLGANVKALTQVGLLPSFVSLPLVFFYLWSLLRGKQNWPLSAFLLSTVLLTHLVAGVFCSLFWLAVLFSGLLKKKPPTLNLVKQLIVVVGLTAFFVIPFIFNYSSLSQSAHLASMFLPNIFIFMFLAAVNYLTWKNKKQVSALQLTAILLSAIILVDALVLRYFDSGFVFEKVYNLHLYRYQIYLYLLSIAIIAYYPAYFLFEFLRRPKVKSELVVVLPIVVLFLACIWRSPFVVDQARISVDDAGVEGRFLEVFSREDAFPLVYASQNELVINKNKQWAYGLFTDSNPNGPYLGSLIAAFDPFKKKESSSLIERVPLDRAKSYQALDLFAIENLLFIDPNYGLTRDRLKTKLLKSGVGAELVEVPSLPIKEVSTDWDNAVKDWWQAKGQFTNLLVESSEKHKISTSSAAIKEVKHSKDWTKLSFEVEAAVPTPILVKFTKSPFWKAKINGQETHIYTASPHLMLVFGEGKVEFSYEKLWYQTLSLWISSFTLVVILVASVLKLFQRNAKR